MFNPSRPDPRKPNGSGTYEPKQELLNSSVNVGWLSKPKKKGQVPTGHLQGRYREDVRRRAEDKTKLALEKANSTHPPRMSQWTSADIRHDYATDSSGTLTKDGQQGSSKPHVNALAHAANGYRRTMHIDWNGKIEPKPKPAEHPKGPYVYDGSGKCYTTPKAANTQDQGRRR